MNQTVRNFRSVCVYCISLLISAYIHLLILSTCFMLVMVTPIQGLEVTLNRKYFYLHMHSYVEAFKPRQCTYLHGSEKLNCKSKKTLLPERCLITQKSWDQISTKPLGNCRHLSAYACRIEQIMLFSKLVTPPCDAACPATQKDASAYFHVCKSKFD